MAPARRFSKTPWNGTFELLGMRVEVEAPAAAGNFMAPPLDRSHGLAGLRVVADAEVPIATREHV